MFTKQTINFGFPQWEPNNHPDFIGDMNPAYAKIDAELHGAKQTADSTKEIVDELQPIVTVHTEAIEKNRQDIATNALNIANNTHSINDNRNNIAKNSADVLAVQTDNHQIHENMDSHLADFQTVLNFLKLEEERVFEGTTVSGDSTINVVVKVSGLRFTALFSGATFTAQPGFNKFTINLTGENAPTGIKYESTISESASWGSARLDASDGQLALVIQNTTTNAVSGITFGNFTKMGFFMYDQYKTAQEALNLINS